MDYSEQTSLEIFSAIEVAIKKYGEIYEINTIFIDATNSVALEKSAENNGWTVFPADLYEFLTAIAEEIPDQEESDDKTYILPHDKNTDNTGVIPASLYEEISKNSYLLHKNFPISGDEAADSDRSYKMEYRFSRGEDIMWSLVSKGILSEISIFNSVYNKITTVITEKRSRVFYLTHAPGFGGSTVAKHVAYRMKEEYPVLFLKSYEKDSFAENFKKVYRCTNKTVVVFIESSSLTQPEKAECIDALKGSTMPHLIVFVERSSKKDKDNKDKSYHIHKYPREDIERIIRFNKDALDGQDDKLNDNIFLSYSAETFITELKPENCSPFMINLSIYQKDFFRIEKYIAPHLAEINGKPELKNLFIDLWIFSRYASLGIPVDLAASMLGVKSKHSDMPEILKEKFDALLFTDYDQDLNKFVIYVRHPVIAESLWEKLSGSKDNSVGEMNLLKDTLITLISDLKMKAPNTDFGEKAIRKIFIDRMSNAEKEIEINEADEAENLGIDYKNRDLLKKYFAPVFQNLWSSDKRDIAGSVFECLAGKYNENAFYQAHAARYFAYMAANFNDFEKSDKYIKKAKEIAKDNTEIWHISGMCISKKYYMKSDEYKEMVSLGADELNVLCSIIDELAANFDKCRKYTDNNNLREAEYARTAWLKALMNIISLASSHQKINDKKIEEYIGTARELIFDLEIIYSASEFDDDDNNKYSELLRKKQVLKNYCTEDNGKQLQEWNNFYENNRNRHDYKNCLFACKRRYFTIEDITEGFTKIGKENKDRIERLANDYLHSLSYVSTETLSQSDLGMYISIARHAGVKIDNVSQIVNELYYDIDDDSSVTILFYRYIFSFLKAYNGDRQALLEAKEKIKTCSLEASKLRNRTTEYEYFTGEFDMKGILNRSHIRNAIKKTTTSPTKEKRSTARLE